MTESGYEMLCDLFLLEKMKINEPYKQMILEAFQKFSDADVLKEAKSIAQSSEEAIRKIPIQKIKSSLHFSGGSEDHPFACQECMKRGTPGIRTFEIVLRQGCERGRFSKWIFGQGFRKTSCVARCSCEAGEKYSKGIPSVEDLFSIRDVNSENIELKEK